MKKIKLLAPILGTIAAAGMILPTVSCGGGGQQEDEGTYKVSISEGFSISRDHAKEDAEFEADISWNDATKAINTTTMKITVGNQVLGPGDYRYTPSTSDAKSGHLKIFKNVINGTVVIEVELLSITQAPIEIRNISDSTVGVSVRASKGTADVGNDLELVISWINPTNATKYFANLITIFVGNEQIPSASKREGGYVIKDYTEESTTILIPGQNIKDNTAISILVDLEESSYTKAAEMKEYTEKYIRYGSGSSYTQYDVIKTQGDRDTDEHLQQLLHVNAGQTLEFKANLNEFLRDFNSDASGSKDTPIYLAFGYWYYDSFEGYLFNSITPILARCGNIYYNGVALTCTIRHDTNLNYIEIAPPQGGWGEWSTDGAKNRGTLTGWYTFSDSYSLFQIIVGQEHLGA